MSPVLLDERPAAAFSERDIIRLRRNTRQPRADRRVSREVEPAFVAPSPREGEHLRIEPGQIAAVTHAARGVLAGQAVIDLEITFGFFDPTDEVAAGDDYRIVGEEQVIDLRSPVGFDSFLSTIAAAANAAAAVVDAEPGLISMGDLSARDLAAKGERRGTSYIR